MPPRDSSAVGVGGGVSEGVVAGTAVGTVGVGDTGDGVLVDPEVGVDVAPEGEGVGDGSVVGAQAATLAMRMRTTTTIDAGKNPRYTATSHLQCSDWHSFSTDEPVYHKESLMDDGAGWD